jgi:hypothetical protein
MQLTESAAAYLEPHLSTASGDLLSTYGTLFLAGSMAAARSDDRSKTRAYLSEADDAARRLGVDGNHLWTAFGPTNVAIHRVNTAMELGDVQIALDHGPNLDTGLLPVERQVRHSLDVARAYNASGQREAAVATVLTAERVAPEQVRHHYLSRQLVQHWVRTALGKPSFELDRLARRMHVVG